MKKLLCTACLAVIIMTVSNPVSAAQAAVAPGAYRRYEPVRLYTGKAPGSEKWTRAEATSPDGSVFYNVIDPTYTAYIPDAARNTRTGVLVAPGGAFRILAMNHEGHQVAQWLAERGIAAFVLKYRVVQIEDMSKIFPAPGEPQITMIEAGQYGVADGVQALKMIRARAGEYGIDADKLVAVGFSAGAHLVSYLGVSADVALRPNYVAPIYGAPFGGVPPIPAPTAADKLPPFFLAMAQDDTLVGPDTRAFYDALFKVGYRPALHLYSAGSHGFGMNRQGTDSDGWIDDFFQWLHVNDLTMKPGDPPRPPPPPSMFGPPPGAAPAGR